MLKQILLSILVTFSFLAVKAQCNVTYSGPTCITAPITFFHNAPGSKGWKWDFGDGNTSTTSSPTYNFTTPGTYKVCATLTTANNVPCKSCVNVVILANPIPDLRLITADTQCFNGNKFCFIDSTKPAPGSQILRCVVGSSDGAIQSFNNPISGQKITKSYQDPNGGTYDITLEVTDANGCIAIKKYPRVITVRASLGLDVFIPSDQKCDSVEAKIINSSIIGTSELTSFEWDFGDGTKNNSNYKPAPNHVYTKEGPNNGWWDVKLKAESIYGCTDSIVFKDAVRNLILNPQIVSSKDSTCLSNSEICFNIINVKKKNGGGFDTSNTITGMTGFRWDFGHPKIPTPERYNDKDLKACHTYGSGEFEAGFTFYHPICGDRTIFDTVHIIGSQAIIEDPINGVVIAQNERYQCSSTKAIQFTNASVHNSKGVYRIWDFDDPYAARCTTDTKNGLNIGNNCNFSKDSLPVHKYKDWEDIYRDSFYKANVSFAKKKYNDLTNQCFIQNIDTNNKVEHRAYFYQQFPREYFPSLTLKDVNDPNACENTAVSRISIHNANADEVRFSGVYCLGSASREYGVNIHLGSSYNYAYVNFDANLDPNAWVKMHDSLNGSIQTGLRPGGPPVSQPYSRNGSYGDVYSVAYSPSMIKNRKTGCAKIGIIVGNGVEPGKYPACVDTQYFEDVVCFPLIDPSFEILEPTFSGANDNLPISICKGSEITLRLTNTNISNAKNVNFLQWLMGSRVSGPGTNLSYNQRVLEEYKRSIPDPNNPNRLIDVLYSSRFEKPLHTQSQNIPDVLISIDTIIVAEITKWDTAIDINPIWDVLNDRLFNAGFNIFDFTPVQIRNILQSGNCVDTTGWSNQFKALEYIVPSVRKTLHFRDTSIAPLEKRVINGKTENVMVFQPMHNGKYDVSLAIDGGNGHCVTGTSKIVAVGFLNELILHKDSIIAIDDMELLTARARVRYYNLNPVKPDILDDTRYWDPSKNPGRKYGTDGTAGTKEDFVKWDWSKEDDTISNPITIFGGSPYGTIGYDSIELGGSQNALYYNSVGAYTMRMTTGDSTRSPKQCRDTISQNIYVVGVKAGFSFVKSRPQCSTIIEIVDSSEILDPCLTRIGKSCSRIINYYINFGDGKGFNQWPANIWNQTKIGWDYTNNGKYTITLIVESDRGAFDTMKKEIVIDGPQPKFETTTSREICINESVSFLNKSVDPTTIATWTMSFGDGSTETINYANSNGGKNTFEHVYDKPGVYLVYLTQFDSLLGENKLCPSTFPDTAINKQTPVSILVNPIDSTILFANNNRDTIQGAVGERIDFKVQADIRSFSQFKFIFDDGDSTSTPDLTTNHVYLKTGTYYAFVCPTIDPFAQRKVCPEKDTVVIVVGWPISIPEFEDMEIGIYPNPVNDKLNFTKDISGEYKILDQFGRIVQKGWANKEIDLIDLSAGMYYVRIEQGNQVFYAKFVKE